MQVCNKKLFVAAQDIRKNLMKKAPSFQLDILCLGFEIDLVMRNTPSVVVTK